MPVPFYLLCGSLGAGKTTLLMRLLEYWKSQGLRTGVLMNEAGEVSIDGPRAGTIAEQVMNLAGGCVCCDTKEDLSWGIAQLVNDAASDVVIMQYPDFGVKLYGNVIIATPKLVKENPAAIKAFLSAFTKGAKEVIANPAKAIESVKARDGIINTELEIRRLKLAIDTVINSPDARAEGFGQLKAPRLALMASQVSDAFNTKSRVNPDVVWNGSFLPSAKELDILPKK